MVGAWRGQYAGETRGRLSVAEVRLARRVAFARTTRISVRFPLSPKARLSMFAGVPLVLIDLAPA